MNQDLLQTALAAVNAIVEDEIKTDTPGHYFHAQKLCALAAQLSNIGGNRVADALHRPRRIPGFGRDGGFVVDGGGAADAAAGDAILGMQEAADNDEFGALVRRAPGGGTMGMVDMLREMLGAFQQQIQLQHTPRPERLLEDLLDVRAKLRQQRLPVPADLKARIDRLVAEVSGGGAAVVNPMEEKPPVVDITPPEAGPEDMQ